LNLRPTASLELGGRSGEGWIIKSRNRDGCARRKQFFGNRFADALAAASHKGDFVHQCHIRLFIP